jgi:hypothetical protein
MSFSLDTIDSTVKKAIEDRLNLKIF